MINTEVENRKKYVLNTKNAIYIYLYIYCDIYIYGVMFGSGYFTPSHRKL